MLFTFLAAQFDKLTHDDEDRESGLIENLVMISLMAAGAIVIVGILVAVGSGIANNTGNGVPGAGTKK